MPFFEKFTSGPELSSIYFKNIDFCPGVFSETARDNWVKLSGIVDLSIVCGIGAVLSVVVTSGRHRKW